MDVRTKMPGIKVQQFDCKSWMTITGSWLIGHIMESHIESEKLQFILKFTTAGGNPEQDDLAKSCPANLDKANKVNNYVIH